MRIETIIRVVCRELDVIPEMLQLPTHRRDVCNARQICHYFAKEFTKMSLRVIGEEIGGKSHATVLYSLKTVNNLIFSNRKFRNKIVQIRIILIDIKHGGSRSNFELLKSYDNLIMSTFAINDIYHE